MIDTIMALWNQPPQRRGLKIFLTFLLICISISLLVAVVSNAWLTHTNRTGQDNSVQQHVTQGVTETASISQVAVTATPTTVVIAQNCANSGQKATPTAAQHSTAIAQTGFGPRQQTTPTVTTPHLRPTSPPTSKATPSPAPTRHVISTPRPTETGVTSPTATPVLSPTMSVGVTATPTLVVTSTPTTSVLTPTPVLPTITPGSSPVTTATSVTPTPTVSIIASATSQHNTSEQGKGLLSGGGPSTPPVLPTPSPTTPAHTGWTTACTGDALLMPIDSSMFTTLPGVIGFVLLGSLTGTLLFYGVMYGIDRRRRRVQ